MAVNVCVVTCELITGTQTNSGLWNVDGLTFMFSFHSLEQLSISDRETSAGSAMLVMDIDQLKKKTNTHTHFSHVSVGSNSCRADRFVVVMSQSGGMFGISLAARTAEVHACEFQVGCCLYSLCMCVCSVTIAVVTLSEESSRRASAARDLSLSLLLKNRL